ncbi:hypothetical protein SUDANB121_05979 (plasmid) [Nocardiopsis dassonvillei]|uniref:hypothetical protein n=1 Tax=Nocardiopsis dassonvillei TaxID=2014 RepID=UPI003F5475F2
MDDNEHQDHAVVDDGREQTEPRGRGRGGSLAGITAALSRPAAGAGLAHWGGPAPTTRREPVPIDVAGGALPGPGALPAI